MKSKQQRYKDKLREAGLIPVQVWTYPKHKQAVMSYDERKELKMNKQALRQRNHDKARSERIDEGK